MKTMSLLQEWRDYAYAYDLNSRSGQLFWANYFNIEKEIYKVLLANADKVWEGSVASLAKEFNTELRDFVGFLDGINDSLVTPNPIEEMNEETKVSLAFDKEKLYYNMVGAKADWLYGLEEWDSLLTPERRKELYREQKNSTTVVKDKKIGRNDPCPCGSGKKYKHCCGANA
jgi:preprotein translocase subunit SecA